MQVFDGHSGPDAANYAKNNLPIFFAGYLQADNLLQTDMHEAMVRVGNLHSQALLLFCCAQQQ